MQSTSVTLLLASFYLHLLQHSPIMNQGVSTRALRFQHLQHRSDFLSSEPLPAFLKLRILFNFWFCIWLLDISLFDQSLLTTAVGVILSVFNANTLLGMVLQREHSHYDCSSLLCARCQNLTHATFASNELPIIPKQGNLFSTELSSI